MATLTHKIYISAFSSVIFFLFNLPETYKLIGSVLSLKLINGLCPTNIGVVLHTLLFFIFSFMTMGDPRKEMLLKIKYSLYGTLIFYFVSSPALYGITNKLLQNISSNCPNKVGILLHSFVYCLLLVAIMYLPTDKSFKK